MAWSILFNGIYMLVLLSGLFYFHFYFVAVIKKELVGRLNFEEATENEMIGQSLSWGLRYVIFSLRMSFKTYFHFSDSKKLRPIWRFSRISPKLETFWFVEAFTSNSYKLDNFHTRPKKEKWGIQLIWRRKIIGMCTIIHN